MPKLLVISNATKRAPLANPSRPPSISVEKQRPNKATKEDVEKGSFAAVEPNIPPPTGGTSLQRGASGLGELNNSESYVARGNERKGTVQHIDGITSTDVPGDVEEQKGKETRLPSEILQKGLPEVLKYLHTLMNEVPIDEVKPKDAKRLSNLNRRLTDYLTKGQGSIVSGTSEASSNQRGRQRLQTSEEQNRTTISEGTYDQGTFNLDDLVQLSRANPNAQLNDRLKSLKEIVGNVFLVMKNGHPSPLLLKLWRQILSEVSHLHDKGITHGHLKPQSILISQERSFSKGESSKGLRLCAKPIFNTGHDILELREPEQYQGPSIENSRAESADIHSLGEIFFYSITGRLPSVDEFNIVKNKNDSSLVGSPEANDLISHMLMENPESRPTAIEVLEHPLFWSSEKRNSFLRDTSERVNPDDPDDLLRTLEGITVDQIVGKENGNEVQTWDKMIHGDMISYVNRRKWKYDFGNVRELLLYIRNTKVHYIKLPRNIKYLIGRLHKGFDRYFRQRFPMLLIEVYKAVSKCCKSEEHFCRYFGGDLHLAN